MNKTARALIGVTLGAFAAGCQGQVYVGDVRGGPDAGCSQGSARAECVVPISDGQAPLEAGDVPDVASPVPDVASPMPEASPESESGVPTVGSASGTELFTPTQVQAARANCALPHGPAVPTATVGEKRARLARSWLLCSSQGPSQIGVGASPVAFGADGTWNNLFLDAQGGLVAGFGVENQGTYMIGDFPDAGPSQPLNGDYNLYIWLASGGGNADPTSFETSPDRMYVEGGSGNASAAWWFVPVPAP